MACENAPVPFSLVYGTNSRREAARLLPLVIRGSPRSTEPGSVGRLLVSMQQRQRSLPRAVTSCSTPEAMFDSLRHERDVDASFPVGDEPLRFYGDGRHGVFEWVACEKAPVPCSLVHGTNSRNEASRFPPPRYQQPADVRRTWNWGKDGGLVVSTFSALGKNDVKAHSRQLASSPLETKPTTPYTQSTKKHLLLLSPPRLLPPRSLAPTGRLPN